MKQSAPAVWAFGLGHSDFISGFWFRHSGFDRRSAILRYNPIPRFFISERVRNLTTEGAESARRFACDAARLADASRCRDVIVLDVRGISPVTDFFVIATGSSGRQMKSVAEEIEELGQPRGFNPFGRNGHEGESWILTDFVDVVLHVFSPTSRSYYDLDSLWGDAPRVDWAVESPVPAR